MRFFGFGTTVVTHNGEFHSDDLFSVALLRIVLGRGIRIVRTRDIEKIRIGDYVVDVGGEYSASRNRFDHHQEGGAGERQNKIPYASFGLVWKQFGESVCRSKRVADIIDEKLVAPIDGHDNGVEICDPVFVDVTPYYIERFFSLYRPTWKESPQTMDQRFKKALQVAEFILRREIKKTQDKVEAETCVDGAYEQGAQRKLLVLDRGYPWHETATKYPELLFVVTPSDVDKTWRLHTVRKNLTSFENRKDLPATWAGKRDTELQKITGVSDAIFCHNKRFLAVAKSKEGVMKLAELALTNKID